MLDALYNAIIQKLRGDGQLVSLTEHTVSPPDFRIGRGHPTTVGKKPYLAVDAMVSTPLTPDVSAVEKARIVFTAISSDPVKCMQIAGRVKALLSNQTPRDYWNFTNSSIVNKGTTYKGYGKILEYDDNLKCYSTEVHADAVWSDGPCS
jgi:hypothetical protein